MNAVGNGIAYYGKILMAVGANQRAWIRFAVQPESVLSFEFYAVDTDTAAVAVQSHFLHCRDTTIRLYNGDRATREWSRQFYFIFEVTALPGRTWMTSFSCGLCPAIGWSSYSVSIWSCLRSLRIWAYLIIPDETLSGYEKLPPAIPSFSNWDRWWNRRWASQQSR